MRNMAVLFFYAIAVLLLFGLWTSELVPVALQSSGDEIITIGDYFDGETLVITEGEMNITITQYFTDDNYETVIEIRLNNTIHELQRVELPIGISGTLYSLNLNVSPNDNLTTTEPVKLYAEGNFQAQLQPQIKTENRIAGTVAIVVISVLLTMGIFYATSQKQ